MQNPHSWWFNCLERLLWIPTVCGFPEMPCMTILHWGNWGSHMGRRTSGVHHEFSFLPMWDSPKHSKLCVTYACCIHDSVCVRNHGFYLNVTHCQDVSLTNPWNTSFWVIFIFISVGSWCFLWKSTPQKNNLGEFGFWTPYSTVCGAQKVNNELLTPLSRCLVHNITLRMNKTSIWLTGCYCSTQARNMMERCVMAAECSPYMECDGNVQNAPTMMCAPHVTMAISITWDTSFTGSQPPMQTGQWTPTWCSEVNIMNSEHPQGC